MNNIENPNQTIYVLTDGCYSDYHIVGVFTDKEKAYDYAKLHCCDVEEYETMDNITIVKGVKIEVYYRKPLFPGKKKEAVEIKIRKCQITEENEPETMFQYYRMAETMYLKMIRFLPGEFEFEGDLRSKYEKAAYDTMAYCQERVSQGYSDEQINEFLSSKLERGKIE